MFLERIRKAFKQAGLRDISNGSIEMWTTASPVALSRFVKALYSVPCVLFTAGSQGSVEIVIVDSEDMDVDDSEAEDAYVQGILVEVSRYVPANKDPNKDSVYVFTWSVYESTVADLDNSSDLEFSLDSKDLMDEFKRYLVK